MDHEHACKCVNTGVYRPAEKVTVELLDRIISGIQCSTFTSRKFKRLLKLYCLFFVKFLIYFIAPLNFMLKKLFIGEIDMQKKEVAQTIYNYTEQRTLKYAVTLGSCLLLLIYSLLLQFSGDTTQYLIIENFVRSTLTTISFFILFTGTCIAHVFSYNYLHKESV